MQKTALITGASGGLGGALARVLHEGGYQIALNYHNNREAAMRLSGLLGEGSSFAVRADVGSYEETESMFDLVIRKWGNIDALVNCAGVARDRLIIKETSGGWDEVLKTNLTGPFNTTKIFAGAVSTSKIPPGHIRHIVNVSSFSGLKGKTGQAAYSASKAALIGLTKAGAVELAEYNICVNAVLPGYMDTKMGRSAQGAMALAKETSALKRLSSPEEVARFVAELVKLEGITGQIFAVESRIL